MGLNRGHERQEQRYSNELCARGRREKKLHFTNYVSVFVCACPCAYVRARVRMRLKTQSVCVRVQPCCSRIAAVLQNCCSRGPVVLLPCCSRVAVLLQSYYSCIAAEIRDQDRSGPVHDRTKNGVFVNSGEIR